jgi:transcriptional regulator with XRE-family HTH domain
MRDPFGTPGAEPERSPEEQRAVEIEAQAARDGHRGFGRTVQQLRVDQEITLGQAAMVLRTSVGTVSQVERSRLRATAEQVRLFSVLLSVPFTVLFDAWDEEAADGAERTTVAEAKAMVQRLLGAGVDCPCCGRLAKEQRRTLTPPMCQFMQWLVDEYRGEPVLITPWVKQESQHGGDYAKVVHWGLAERRRGKAPLWTPTDKGRKFTRNQVKVRRFAVVWRNEVLRHEGPLVDLFALLGDKHEHPEREGKAQALPGMERA